MVENSKNAFWQALILTVAIFLIGIFIGVAYEGSRLTKVNDYYVLSEISLMDAFALSKLTDVINATDAANCKILIDSGIEFADRIYNEAITLEKYEDSGRLIDTIKLSHKKYDLLRTLLWINFMNIPDTCKKDTSVVIYLYEYNTEDLVKKATNKVWSRILFDLKQQEGKNIILIPIAADNDLISLNSLISRFNISSYPAVIIDEKYVVSEVKSVEDLEKYLKK